MHHSLTTLTALALGCIGLSSVAAELPAAIKAKGEITVALVANYPPLEMKDPKTGQLVGLDVELGEALGKKLGVKIKWEETSFVQFMPSLTTGRADMVISGFGDLPARQETVTFVDYLRSGLQLFTQHARAAEFPNAQALCGKNVGASRRTSYPAEITEWSDANCVAKGLPPIKITGTEGSADARTQLRQGRIDAAGQGDETLPYLMELDPNTFALVGEPIRHTLMGIAMPRDQTELHQAVAEALRALIADGTYQRLLEKYQMTPNAITEVTINGGT